MNPDRDHRTNRYGNNALKVVALNCEDCDRQMNSFFKESKRHNWPVNSLAEQQLLSK
jgi:hypothetical protein